MSLSRSIRKNLGLKCLSICLAILSWLIVHYENRHGSLGNFNKNSMTTEVFEEIPVTVLGSSRPAGEYQIYPAHVTVTISGPTSYLRNMTGTDLPVFVNLARDERIDITTRKVEVYCPPGVSLVRVLPPVVNVERVQKKP